MTIASNVLSLTLTLAAAADGPKLPPGAPAGTKAYRDVAYVPDGHERQKLDLFVPPGDGPKPLVIWIHGGAFVMGDKRGRSPAFPLLGEGFAVASINYRLSQHAVFPAAVEDAKAAVRFLRKHAGEYGVDPDRFGAWGASAGGYQAAMLGTTASTKAFDVGENLEVSSAVQCVVDEFGPTDFTKMTEQAKAVPGSDEHDSPDSPESKLLGGPVQENPEKAAKADPCTYVTRDAPPFLIMHGDRDKLVPYGQSVLLVDALKKVGAPVVFHTVEGGGHGDGFGEPERRAASGFLTKHLKGGPPAGSRPRPISPVRRRIDLDEGMRPAID